MQRTALGAAADAERYTDRFRNQERATGTTIITARRQIDRGEWSLLVSVRRVVPDIKSQHFAASRTFYVDFLGLELAMDMGSIMTFVSPSNATAQISVVRDDGGSTLLPDMSVEVADVNQVHERAVERGLKIVYPLTDEPWGVRRFFVVDPNGTILNILSHLPIGSK
jgi:catechol 2,3-dioxygenase-like lactoylglutathione lyase family enzyme